GRVSRRLSFSCRRLIFARGWLRWPIRRWFIRTRRRLILSRGRMSRGLSFPCRRLIFVRGWLRWPIRRWFIRTRRRLILSRGRMSRRLSFPGRRLLLGRGGLRWPIRRWFIRTRRRLIFVSWRRRPVRRSRLVGARWLIAVFRWFLRWCWVWLFGLRCRRLFC